MADKSSTKKRSRKDSSNSEITGNPPAKQDPSQSETPTGIKGRNKRTKPGPKPKSTRGKKKPVRKQTREVSLRRNRVKSKSRAFLSSLGPTCSTRSIQIHVERLNQLNTERKVKILLKDLKKADKKNPQNATKWLQVFCDQITAEGCEDAESLVPKVVRTWMLQRPDLFDFLTVERLVRYCNSENLPYLPVDDEDDTSEEEMGEEASIPDIDEEQSQNAPSEAENVGNSTDYHALHLEADNDPYAAGPSNRLRPIPSHLQIAMQSGLNLENGELNGHYNDQFVEGRSDSDSEETWHSTEDHSIMGLEVGDQGTPQLEFGTKDLKMEIDSDSDTPTVMLGNNLNMDIDREP